MEALILDWRKLEESNEYVKSHGINEMEVDLLEPDKKIQKIKKIIFDADGKKKVEYNDITYIGAVIEVGNDLSKPAKKLKIEYDYNAKGQLIKERSEHQSDEYKIHSQTRYEYENNLVVRIVYQKNSPGGIEILKENILEYDLDDNLKAIEYKQNPMGGKKKPNHKEVIRKEFNRGKTNKIESSKVYVGYQYELKKELDFKLKERFTYNNLGQLIQAEDRVLKYGDPHELRSKFEYEGDKLIRIINYIGEEITRERVFKYGKFNELKEMKIEKKGIAIMTFRYSYKK